MLDPHSDLRLGDHDPTDRSGPRAHQDAVHAEVARYLTDPAALHAVSAPTARDSLCDDDALHRLKLFSGFITKIKHNGLRRPIPCTLRLLAALEIELDFFASVSPAYAELRRPGPVPIDRHLDWFASQLDSWLTRTQPRGGALVADVFTHEIVVADLRQSEDGAPSNRSPKVPCFVGAARVRRYETDALHATRKLLAGIFDPETDWIVRDLNVLYHRLPGQPLTMLEVDPLVALALSRVDGTRSVDAMASELAAKGFAEVTSPVLHSVFTEAAEQGLLEYGR